MPVEYKIVKSLGIVFSDANGVLIDADAIVHQDMLRSDPDFDPSFQQVLDFTDVTEFKLSTQAIHTLAQRNPFGKGFRRAFVAPSRIAFGCARMFQILTDEYEDEINVFEEMSAALDYLGLKKEQFVGKIGPKRDST